MLQTILSENVFKNLIKNEYQKSFVLTVLLIFSTNLCSAEIQSSGYYAVSLPWVSLQSGLNEWAAKEIQKSISYQVGQQQLVVQDFQFTLEPLVIQLRAQAVDSLINQNGIRLRMDGLQLQAQSQGISINQVIEKIINGHRIRIHVQAQCEPFQLQVRQGGLNVAYSWLDTLKGIQIRQEIFQVQIPSESIVLSELKCQGLEGLGSEIEKEIKSSLTSQAKIQEFAKSSLEGKLNQFIQEKWNFHKLGTQYRMQKNGIAFFRNMDVPLSFDPDILRYQIDEKDSEPKVVLTEKNLNQMIIQLLQQHSKIKMNLNTVEAFQKLLKSRFLQFFLWPDLMNFSKSAKFEMESSALSNLTLSQSGSNYRIGGVVQSTVRGERKGLVWDYLKISSRIQGQVDIGIQNGLLNLDIHDVESEMSWKFATDYEKEFEPSSRISSTIRKKLNEALMANRKMQLPLPLTEFGDRRWLMKSIQYRDQYVEIGLVGE